MPNIIHATGIIFENPQGEILVLKRHPSQPEGNTWGLVGGKVSSDETSVQTAVKKCLAETGFSLDIKKLIFIKKYHLLIDNQDIEFDVYKYPITENFDVNIDPVGSTEYAWQKPEYLIQQSNLMTGLYPIIKDHYINTSGL